MMFAAAVAAVLIAGLVVAVAYLFFPKTYYRWAKHWRNSRARIASVDAELAAIDAMDGIGFEHYVADLLLKRGFRRAEVTKASGDFGVDILAEGPDGKTYAIQCKRYDKNVPRNAVTDAVAGARYYGKDAAIVVTNSALSSGAQKYARELECEIVDRAEIRTWIDAIKRARDAEDAAWEEAQQKRLAPPSAGASWSEQDMTPDDWKAAAGIAGFVSVVLLAAVFVQA